MAAQVQGSTLSDDDARAVLAAAQQARHHLDLDAMVGTLDPDIELVFNFGEPVHGIDAVTEWLRHRFNTQLGYRLHKQLRGVYRRTVVAQWTGAWYDASGEHYRTVGLELRTVGANGLITRREATSSQRSSSAAVPPP